MLYSGSDMALCKNCGLCCLIVVSGSRRDCGYLKREGKKTACMIYDTRLNKDLGDGHRCSLRENAHVNYPGCPYNNEGWAMHPAYK